MADPVEWLEAPFGGGEGVEWPVDDEPALGERNGFIAWLQYGLARGATGLLNACPSPVRRAAVAGLARFAYLALPARARMADDYIATALPDLSASERKQRVLRAWRHLFEISLASEEIEKRLLGKPLGEHFDFEISDEVKELLASKQGCLFVTSHIGHWEIAPGALSAIGFRALYVVGKPPKNRPLSKHLQRMRELLGIRVLARRGAMRTIPSVLKAGGHVAMLLDQRARLKPAIAPFFGRPARCDRSAAVLVRRLKVPIIMGGCVATETPWRFRLIMDTVVRAEDLQGAGPEEVVAHLNSRLERLILRYPDQYFWLHDRYRDAPPAAEAPRGAQEGATSPDSVSNGAARGA